MRSLRNVEAAEITFGRFVRWRARCRHDVESSKHAALALDRRDGPLCLCWERDGLGANTVTADCA